MLDDNCWLFALCSQANHYKRQYIRFIKDQTTHAKWVLRREFKVCSFYNLLQNHPKQTNKQTVLQTRSDIQAPRYINLNWPLHCPISGLTNEKKRNKKKFHLCEIETHVSPATCLEAVHFLTRPKLGSFIKTRLDLGLFFFWFLFPIPFPLIRNNNHSITRRDAPPLFFHNPPPPLDHFL